MAFPDGTTWSEALPDDNTVANQIDDYNRDLRAAVRLRLAKEHVFPAADNTGTVAAQGHHSFITLQAQTAPTMAGTTAGCLYVASSSAGYALVFINSAGTGETLVNASGKLAVITTGTLGGLPICSSANPSGLLVLVGPTSTTLTSFVLVSSNNATGGVQAPVWAHTMTGVVVPAYLKSYTPSEQIDRGTIAVGAAATTAITFNLVFSAPPLFVVGITMAVAGSNPAALYGFDITETGAKVQNAEMYTKTANWIAIGVQTA